MTVDIQPLWGQSTARYKTYLKEIIVEAFRQAWSYHPDETVKDTKIDIEFPIDRNAYPALVVKFYERDIPTAGVGHIEWLPDDEDSTRYLPYQHTLYHGDVEFMVYGLSSYDRDIVADALVQTIKFGQTTQDGTVFYDRLYYEEDDSYAAQHYVNINSDNLAGYGETQTIAPWMPEDVLVYQVSYRVPVFGEFYSPIPTDQNWGMIEVVDTYPYDEAGGETKPTLLPEVGITPWTSEIGQGPFHPQY